MEIGFAAPVSGSWATPENLVYVSRRAEALGYHTLWTFQRLLAPVDNSWGEVYRSVLDPIVALSYVAANTSHIRLGTAVLNMPFFTPVLLAKQLATIDIVSGGRLDAGLGIGWSDEEYAAVGVPKEHRGRRAEDFLVALTKLWTDDIVEHDGEFYRIPRSRMEPKPVQKPRPPILIGGTAAPALRRAGRLSDGWISSSRADLATIGESVAIVKAAAEEAGRDPRALRFVCRGVVQVRHDGERKPLTGTLDEIREDFKVLEEQGITEVFVDLNFDPQIGSPDADPKASMRRADEALEALAPDRKPEE
jgi:probable F420-dependent oxidoreductase